MSLSYLLRLGFSESPVVKFSGWSQGSGVVVSGIVELGGFRIITLVN